MTDDKFSLPGTPGQPVAKVSLDKSSRSGNPFLEPQSAPAGWYQSSGELRWWDGAQWTEHRAQQASNRSPAADANAASAGPRLAGSIYRIDARTNAAEIAIAWVITVLTVGYMLPWAIAATRGKSNSMAIAAVNLLVGWTVLGWIVALVMACTSHQVVASRY